jgi:hypothetical protein
MPTSPPPPPNQFPDDYQCNLYKGLVIDNAYQFEPGVCVLPVAEDAPTDPQALAAWSPVVVVRLHAPYRLRRAVYRSDKQTNPPVLPEPADTGAFVFLKGTASLANSINMDLSTFDWSGVGDYLFVENCVSRTEDGLVLGSPPWLWLSTQLNSVTTAPTQGAVVQAGQDAWIGYSQGLDAAANNASGGNWWYNTSSYYPGTMFDGAILNAGPPYLSPPSGS